MRRPDFDDLVGADLEGADRERLHGVHDLLLAAGPPPELPPALRFPPGPQRDAAVRELRSAFPRRRVAVAVAFAAALALAAFGGGYLVGDREETATAAVEVVKLIGTDAAQGAVASLRIHRADDAGNHLVELTVRGLEELPRRGYYELGMTKDGELVASCGFFDVEGEKTEVTLNAPYDPDRYDGWAVVAHGERDERSDFLLTSES